VRKHPSFFSPKHAAPATAVAILGLGGLALLDGRTRAAGLLAWAAYLSAIAGGGLLLARKHRFARPDLVALALGALHFGYGTGTLVGLWNLAPGRKRA
jgi:hypothetical protein